jgi:hypothetical protein
MWKRQYERLGVHLQNRNRSDYVCNFQIISNKSRVFMEGKLEQISQYFEYQDQFVAESVLSILGNIDDTN